MIVCNVLRGILKRQRQTSELPQYSKGGNGVDGGVVGMGLLWWCYEWSHCDFGIFMNRVVSAAEDGRQRFRQ